jgi:PAS domain S-box-containing protein
MNYFSHLHIISSIIYFCMAAFILYKNFKSPLNRVTAGILLCLGLWSYGMTGVHNLQSTASTARIFDSVSSLGSFSFGVFALWFALLFTEKKRILSSPVLYVAFAVLPVFFIILEWSHVLVVDYVRQPYGWAPVWAESFWMYLFYCYLAILLVPTVFMLALFAHRQKSAIKRRQARVIYITAAIAFALGSVTDLLLPALNIYIIPSIANILAFIWAGGLFHVILRYKFLVLTPTAVADDILSTMNEALVLLDPKGEVVTTNQAARSLLGYSDEDLKGQRLEKIFADPGVAKKIMSEIILQKAKSYDCALKTRDGESVGVLFSCSVIHQDEKLSGVVCVARDVREQLQAKAEMEKTEARYRSLVEKAGIAILVSDRDGSFRYFNKRFADLFGYSVKEMEGMSIQIIVHPEDVGWVMGYHESRFKGEKAPHRYEFRGVRKDGSVLHLEIDVTALRERGRVVGTRAYIWNITTRKRIEEQLRKAQSELETRVRERTEDLVRTNEALQNALAEKEVLLREIHHRVKNNLQVISSIINLQSRHAEDDHIRAVLEESRSRIQSMTMVYEQLYHAEDLSRIDFRKYVQDLTRALHASHHIDHEAISLSTDIDDFKLDIGTAVPCGLIISELVLNALKYAFPDNREGKIDVAFRAGDNMECTLIVRDNGIGLPDKVNPESSSTLGLQLVCALVEQLEGSIQITRNNGVEFIIKFKRGDRRRHAKGKDTGRRR